MRASEDRVQGISFFGASRYTLEIGLEMEWGAVGLSPPDETSGIWFSNTLSYDAETSTATWEQVNRETSEVVLSIARAVTGVFGDEMVNLGVAHHPFGDPSSSSVFSVDPTHYQITMYDNIKVSGTSKVTPAAPLLVLTAPEAALGGDTVEVAWDTGTTEPFDCSLTGPGVVYEFDPRRGWPDGKLYVATDRWCRYLCPAVHQPGPLATSTPPRRG